MTMDNGEGRPLDEMESGQQDPQDWYFDLPSDAWQRQEEKNRLLRERVRRNEAEQPERRDPWTLNRPPREGPKKRGLFGFGRKKKEESAEWRGRGFENAGRGWETDEPDEEADGWSTERLVFDEPAQELRLKPREPRPDATPAFGERAETSAPLGPIEPPPLRLRSRSEPPAESRLNWDFGPGAWPESPQSETNGAEDGSEDEENIFARMQAWAERGREEQQRRFGLTHEDLHAGAEEPEGFDEIEAAAGDDDRAVEVAAPSPAAISEVPVDDEGAAEGPGEQGESGFGGGLSLVRRHRTEDSGEQTVERRGSKWEEFFGLGKVEDEGGVGVSEGLAAMREWAKKKPLSDVHDLSEVPEEFLKPFDWEVEERQAGTEPAADPFAAFRAEPAEEPADAWPSAELAGTEPGADPFAAFRVEPVEEKLADGLPDDDPLAGIFPVTGVRSGAAEEEPGPPKRGFFGRLFGRKQEPVSEPSRQAGPPAEGPWDFDTESEPAGGEPWSFEGAQSEAESAGSERLGDWAKADDTPAAHDFTFGGLGSGARGWTDGEGGENEPTDGFSGSFVGDGVSDDDEWAPEVPPVLSVDSAWRVEPEQPRAEETDAEPEWAPEATAMSPSDFGAAVQAAFWSADAEEEVARVPEPASTPEPVADEAPRPWWEAVEAEETVEEAVAHVDVPASPAEPVADEAPRPWWEADEADADRKAPLVSPASAWSSGSTGRFEDSDDDMWGAIAETAQQAADAGYEVEVDLAASLEAQMGAALEEPAWAQASPADEAAYEFVSTEEDGDVILKAFEAHAATPEPEEDPAAVAAREAETAAALEALFGDQGNRIVEEAGEEPEERPFIRMAAWAPQRSASPDDGWGPADEVVAELEARNNPLGFDLKPEGMASAWATPGAVEVDHETAARGDGRLKAWIRELVETVMLAVLIFLSVRASFGNFQVDGNSMYPTLENGQFLIVNKLVYSEVDLEKLSTFLPFIDAGSDPTRYVFHGPERGDIIVLRDPRDPSTDLIKRIIGLPGETIEIVNGKVYINDRLLEEPYITTPWNDTLPKILIPPDEYFVMGDNRNNSLDSRSAQVGLVSKDLIIGKATLSYLPLSRFGLAPNEKGVLTEQKPVLTTKRIGEE
ncbi:signal peptidase I [Tepidiforma sp.]|uniref:signal peptidase I n=1 Tax=Tepidiforma sp. TaxID=2682230 RepID=UPI002ADDD03E|nr:signal peptidase I [Tepidiforma sp.]